MAKRRNHVQAVDAKDVGMSGELRNTGEEDLRVNDDEVIAEFHRSRMAGAEKIKQQGQGPRPPEYPSYAVTPTAIQGLDASRIMRLFYSQGVHGDGLVAGGSRTPEVREVETYYYEDPAIHKLLEEIFKDANNIPFFNFDIDYIEPPHMCVYHGNVQGHYSWHTDTTNSFEYRRCISMSLLLNSSKEFEGGDLELFMGVKSDGSPHVVKPELRNAGDLCIFKSDVCHRVKPVTQGTRAALVTWAWGNWGNKQFGNY